MKEVVSFLIGKMIVSCQAYEETPLYGPEYMRRMAESVLMGGADGIRACWPQDIREIRQICQKPIIGIYKDFPQGDPLDHVFITSTFEQAKQVIEAGADILGIDCTIRPNRKYPELLELLGEIKDTFPQIAVMADISRVEEGVLATESGLVDIVSTTLNGYTRESLSEKTEGPNCKMIKQLKREISVPVNAEGRIWELGQLESVLEAGADMVTIGSAITRPNEITRRFVHGYRQFHDQ